MKRTEVLDALREVRNKWGTLTAELVVEEAANPDHPLHNQFEWDDAEAGYQYRLEQARSLLRVTYRPTAEAKDLRAFWVVKGSEGGSQARYEPVEELILDPVSREVMLRQMRREWASFKRRYEHMTEFVTEILGEVQAIALEPEEEGA